MGLAILAGALGLAFSNVDKISEFSGAGFTAKMKGQIQAVIDKETEVSEGEESEKIGVERVPDNELTVLKALANSKYTWRTFPGICRDVDCDQDDAWITLLSLLGGGLVQTGNKNDTGEMIWSITSKGRQRISKIT